MKPLHRLARAPRHQQRAVLKQGERGTEAYLAAAWLGETLRASGIDGARGARIAAAFGARVLLSPGVDPWALAERSVGQEVADA